MPFEKSKLSITQNGLFSSFVVISLIVETILVNLTRYPVSSLSQTQTIGRVLRDQCYLLVEILE